MASKGVIFKRCGCRDGNGRRLEQRCPRLIEQAHGSWCFHASARNLLGRSERVRRGGYPSQAAARRARDEWLAATGEERTARSWTVERWLRYWLSTRTHLRPTSMLHYTRDVEQVLIPRLGTLRLADLDGPLLRARFAEIAKTTNRKGQPQSPSAMQHLRTTLCAALNHAVREGMIEANPARHIEVRGYRRPHAKVWTDDQVTDWQHTGQRPAVAVWTAEHLATFLTAVTDDSLYALWWLVGLRGLRRGEACGLRWSDIDLDRGVLYIVRNRTTAGYQVIEGPPKTAAGTRAVALDEHTLQILRQHRARQIEKRTRRRAAGKPWQDSGYVFVRMDGLPIHPSNVSCRFRQLLNRIDVPPIRLHDLRHTAASIAHQAGADLKTLQDLLGHSSILVTADTYTSVLPVAQRRCANATAKLVVTAARRTRNKIREKASRNRPQSRAATGTPAPTGPTTAIKDLPSGPEARAVTTPKRHPRDTHRPQQTDTKKRSSRVSAGQPPLDVARPKGLEPLTF
ncbi:tyrosine-type recombinase/integrase [Dactylosporangium sp. NPDC050688]|uniref:tyrosine-type recombinase/integrase n=1 Tax=Dactylosporangium sp. NPDC050688 TaxID=3157217 RepID=UPI0033CBC66E